MNHQDDEIRFDAQLRKVNEILKEMTTKKRPAMPKSKFERKIEEINNAVRSFGVWGFFTMVVLAILTYFSKSSPLLVVTGLLGIPISLLGLAMLILIILDSTPTLIEAWKNPYASLLRLYDTTSEWYFPYVQQLAAYDKNVVAYALTQYKIQREGFERRAGMISGSIEKVGIFHAIGALAALATTLSKAIGLSDWVQALLFLIFAFNFLNFVSAPMLHRMDEVIAVLEYTVTFHTK
jgi:hypothetical protein